MVREAWSVFHAKWGLPADLDFEGYPEHGYAHLPNRPFDPATDYVPLPGPEDVEPLITRHG